MKKISQNKKLLVFGGVFLLALFIVPNIVGAQTSNIITNFGVGVFTGFVKVIGYIFNLIFGLFFALVSWLVEVAMSMNGKILDSSNAIVNIGWGISRDIANLGFVLIMIIVAVATIVRYEKYSVSSSKILPVLIGAAILVNFSLTIAGVLITFSDTVSATFSSRLSSGSFRDAAAGAFDPQRLLLKDTENPAPPDPADVGSALGDFSAAVLTSIAGLIFQIIFLAIATLSMAALALMLLYRYIALSLALVLAPLAWMFWAFPDLKHWFTDWWKFFLKWTFFLPAVTFFMYLAVEASLRLKNTPMLLSGSPFTTTGLVAIMTQGAQMVVTAGLLLGGLMAAQHMGIKGADGAMKLATKTKDATLGFAGRKAIQYGSYPLRRKTAEPGSQSVAEKLTNTASNIKNPIGRALVGTLARGANRIATAGGENVLKEQEARTSKMSMPDVKAALTTAAGPFRVALIKRLSKDKQLSGVDMKSIATKDTKDLFARFNQGKDFGDVEKNGLMTVKVADVLRRKERNTDKSKEKGIDNELAQATLEMVKGMTRKDLETASIKDLFKPKAGEKKFGLDMTTIKTLSGHFADALASSNAGLVPSIVPKLDSESRDNFDTQYNAGINKIPDSTKRENMRKSWDQVMKNYTLGYSPVAEEAGGGGGGAPAGGGGTPKP